MKNAAPLHRTGLIYAAPLMLALAAAILPAAAAWAQDSTAPPPALSEYDNVPPGLLLTPAQRLDYQSNIVPAPAAKNDSTAGLLAPGESAAPVVDPQVPTHSLSVLEQKPVPAVNTGPIAGMPQIEAAYAKGQYAEIIRPLEGMVAQNEAQAMLLLGIMLDAGQGIAANPQRAAELFSRAAQAGLPQAQHRLALMYYQGRGLAKDSLQAMMWLHVAAATYPEGPNKQRAVTDRNNLDAALSRRDRETALFMAREWMTKKGIIHLLENALETKPPADAPAPAPTQPPAQSPSPAPAAQ